MTQTLEVTKQNAIKAYREADSKGKELLENLYGKEVFNLKITDRVKSFEDACEVLGIKPYLPDVSYLRRKDQASIIAQYKLSVVVEVLNEGWTPDWNNISEYKYYPWFNMKDNTLFFGNYGYWHTISSVSSHLCLRTSELATYCGTQFIELYKDLFLEEILFKEEIEKCQNDPHYYATKYLTVNGQPFTTGFTKDEFNDLATKLTRYVRGRG